jgi:hypothetical protein
MRPTVTGIEHPEGQSSAALRDLLRRELARGAQELGKPRSGYDAPVVVGIASRPGGLAAAVPVPVALRADPDAVSERAWLLAAATVGALVEAAGGGPMLAGEAGGSLVLTIEGDDEAELAVVAFEDHVAGVDRLRATAVALPAGVLDDVTDLRAPIGPAHPLRVAAHVARLGGRPALGSSVLEHEDAVMALLEQEAPAVARPHEDPDPARRVARRILQRLNGMGKWGGYHTEFTHLARGFGGNDRQLAELVGERLLEAGLLSEKPSVGQRHVFLNSRRAGEIHALIDHGEVPDGLRLS